MTSRMSGRAGLCRSIISGQAEVPCVLVAREHHHHVPALLERHPSLWLRPGNTHCVPGRAQDVQCARPQRGHASRQNSKMITPANLTCGKHSMNDMHARFTEIMRKRPLTAR